MSCPPEDNTLIFPRSHMSAVDLLKLGDEERTKSFLTSIWPELVGVAFGIGTGIFVNFGSRRPLFSGIQKHVLLSVGYVGILKWVQEKRTAYLAEKDAVLLHYVSLHPEDFPEPAKRKIADIFEPWIPIR